MSGRAGSRAPSKLELDVRFNVYERIFTHLDPADERLWAELHGVDARTYRKWVRAMESETNRAAFDLAGEQGMRAAMDHLPAASDDVVVALGDSVTSDRSSWVEILTCMTELMKAGPTWRNAGVSGDSSAHARARFHSVAALEPDWLLILLGTNDSRRSTLLDGERLVSLEELRQNLTELVALSKAHGAQTVLCTPPPVNSELLEQWTFEEQLAWRNDDIEASARVVREVASGTGAGLVDVWAALSEVDDTELPDGLHPNVRGQRLIARTILTGSWEPPATP